MNDPLHNRLRRAADDAGNPPTTDVHDLLGRARVERSRRRTVTAGAVVLTAVTLVGTTLGVRAALPDDRTAPATSGDNQGAHSGDDATTPASLDDSEVVRRCLPQLAKYDELPMYADTAELGVADWSVVRARDYSPGDVVALRVRQGGSNPVLCVVPESGQEADPVPFTALDPVASDPARVAELCSERFLPQTTYDPVSGDFEEPTGKSRLPDLRDAEVAAIDSVGPVVEALLVQGGKEYACALAPVTWDAGPSGVGRATARSYRVSADGSATGASAKSITDEDASYYYAAGTMPTDARSIDFTFENGSTFTVPVSHGNYAFVLKDPGLGGLVSYDYRVLDASGQVLHEGSEM